MTSQVGVRVRTGARVIARIFAFSFVCALGGACGPTPAKDIGAQLFSDPRTSTSDDNSFACSTCHAVDKDGDAEQNKAGYPLHDTVFRTRFWGGQVTSPLEAMNACLFFFMKSQTFSADEPKSRALYEYLASIASEDAKQTRPLTIVETVTTVPRGNPDQGKDVWDRSCRECHGDPHTGNGRLSDDVVIVPESSEEFARDVDFPVDLVIVEKVRHGNFFKVGGAMPPFAVERLSDEELGAILGYLDAK
jgi:thiosulfate dehydrogenase